jgi:hypothetical protein
MTDRNQWPDGDSGVADDGSYAGELENPGDPFETDAGHVPALEDD